MRDICSDCKKFYEVTKGNSTLYIFVDDSLCNHLISRCTHCKSEQRLFLQWDAVFTLLQRDFRYVKDRWGNTTLRECSRRAWRNTDQRTRYDDLVNGFGRQLNSLDPTELFERLTKRK